MIILPVWTNQRQNYTLNILFELQNGSSDTLLPISFSFFFFFKFTIVA